VKTLLLLRHGKSSWRHPDLADHDRPLKARGRRDAARVGRFLAAEGLEPDVVWCSTAARTRETAEIVLEAAECDALLQTTEELYGAGPGDILRVVAHTQEPAATVLVVGHNPGLGDLVSDCAGRDGGFPTCALAQIAVEARTWVTLVQGSVARWAVLTELWTPKELP